MPVQDSLSTISAPRHKRIVVIFDSDEETEPNSDMFISSSSTQDIISAQTYSQESYLSMPTPGQRPRPRDPTPSPSSPDSSYLRMPGAYPPSLHSVEDDDYNFFDDAEAEAAAWSAVGEIDEEWI